MSSVRGVLLALVVLASLIQGNLAFTPSSRSIIRPSPTSLQVSTSRRSGDRRGGSNNYYDSSSNDNDDDNDRPRPASRNSYSSNRGQGGRQSNSNSNNNRGRRNPQTSNYNNNNDDDDDDRFQQRQSNDDGEEITDTNKHFFSKKSLEDPSLKVTKDIFLPLCQGAGITRPSRIQSLAWPQILNHGNQPVLIADQTGSGKTLAYLLPLLQRALQTTTKSTTTTTSKTNGAPKVLILAPTAELADQIHAVCTKISKTVPFQTMVVTATGKYTTSIRDQIRMVQRQSVDVMISTPGRLSTILRTRNSGLDLTTNLQAIVLDEVDILLIDQTFGPQLRTVGEAAPTLDKTQFVFVTATLPDSIVQKVQKEFPGVQQIRGPGLHRVAPSLKERLVDVSVPSQSNRDAAMCFDVKAKQLLKALRQNRCRRTLIFCNTVESCRTVENLLNRKDRRGQVYDVSAYHNAMTPETRNANLQRFATAGARRHSDDQNNNNNVDVDSVLICTDRAARGVDFDAAPVDHVVIFDFPKDPAEYVRRVGRTARAGRSGTSTVFAYGWQLPVARNVMLDFTLDSFSIAMLDDDDDANKNNNNGGDDQNNSQYESRKLSRKTKKSKDAMIKENIERGRLWDETKY